MLPASKIWVPNLRVYQYSSLVSEIDYSKEDAKISYKEWGSYNTNRSLLESIVIPCEGDVTVSFTTIISSYCSIFGKYYPMDQHTCLLNFQYKVQGLIKFSVNLFCVASISPCRERRL